MRKTATVESNDPDGRAISLLMHGNVRCLIDATPSTSIYFKGRPDEISPDAIEFTGTAMPFSIKRIESNLEGKIRYELHTVEAGRRYRLEVTNLLRFGTYGGFIKLATDLPQKEELVVRVNGAIEGEIRVTPASIFLGKLQAREPERSGRIQVLGTRGRSFEITRLTYNERLIRVVREPLPGQAGYILALTPRLDSLQPGTRESTSLIIETDLAPGEKYEVEIQVVNFSPAPQGPMAR